MKRLSVLLFSLFLVCVLSVPAFAAKDEALRPSLPKTDSTVDAVPEVVPDTETFPGYAVDPNAGISDPLLAIDQDGDGILDLQMFSENDQPLNAVLNLIYDNPDIGNEVLDSIWVTDRDGRVVRSLYADETYTLHIYLRVSGPGSLGSVRIRPFTIDGRVIRGLSSRDDLSRLYYFAKSDNGDAFSWVELWAKDADWLQLTYTPDSAVLHCSGAADGSALPDKALFSTSGAWVGYDELDGILPAGREHAIEVTLEFTTVDPSHRAQAAETPTEQEPPLIEPTLDQPPAQPDPEPIAVDPTPPVKSDNSKLFIGIGIGLLIGVLSTHIYYHRHYYLDHIPL